MIRSARVFATADLGAATTAVALVGRVGGGAHRLLGSRAAHRDVPPEPLLEAIAGRIRAVDPKLAAELGLVPGAAALLPRLEARVRRPATMAILCATDRILEPLVAAVARSGWRHVSATADRHDAGQQTSLLLDPAVSAVLVATGDPPGGDERGIIQELAAAAGAAGLRRPELTIVLAGAPARTPSRLGLPPERLVLVDPAGPADGSWTQLESTLVDLHRARGDGRDRTGLALAGLAGALDRRVELLDVGHDAGLRAIAWPGPAAGAGHVISVESAAGALVPAGLDDARLERIQGWSSLPLDRHRIRDRLLELRGTPWAGASGDGPRLRLAAARAAAERLLALTPDLDEAAAPDLVVIAGGAFDVAPAPAALMALADVRRRTEAVHVALDHARLLGPLGTVADPMERDLLIAELAGDLLLPLGSIVMPGRIRHGRHPGHVRVEGDEGAAVVELEPGALARVPLAPGRRAAVRIEANDPVQLGGLGRRISVNVSGGLAGVLVDLRDVPLHLPDRRELRRELLERWERATWRAGAASARGAA